LQDVKLQKHFEVHGTLKYQLNYIPNLQ
jgi:hypothetical protein